MQQPKIKPEQKYFERVDAVRKVTGNNEVVMIKGKIRGQDRSMTEFYTAGRSGAAIALVELITSHTT